MLLKVFLNISRVLNRLGPNQGPLIHGSIQFQLFLEIGQIQF